VWFLKVCNVRGQGATEKQTNQTFLCHSICNGCTLNRSLWECCHYSWRFGVVWHSYKNACSILHLILVPIFEV